MTYQKRRHGMTLSSTVIWLFAEALFTQLHHLDRKLNYIMALVSVDSDVLASLTTLAQTVDSEVKQLIANGTVPEGDLSGIQSALSDADSALQAAQAAQNPTPDQPAS